MLSLIRDFSEFDDLLISPVSYDEVLAFLLLVKARNSRLLTGRIICLSGSLYFCCTITYMVMFTWLYLAAVGTTCATSFPVFPPTRPHGSERKDG